MSDDSSEQSPFTIELNTHQAYLEGLLGYQLKEDLEALRRCIFVFNKNATELVDHVGEFLQSSQFCRNVSEEYANELVRRLHNYLTAVSSLVDSQRVVMRHRWPEGPVYEGLCEACDRPLLSRESFSEFERNEYAQKLEETFETGEAAFMGKLRNYCTHYSIPFPTLGTTFQWELGMEAPAQVNTLQLQRSKLMRWNGWTRAAKAFLEEQPELIDLVPIIERYVNAAGRFVTWFWAEINSRSLSLIDELNTKALDLQRWYNENLGQPDWDQLGENGTGQVGTTMRRRAKLREERYRLGTRSFGLWAVDSAGLVDSARRDYWTPTPLRMRYY